MTRRYLAQTASQLMSPGKGLLAIDESIHTCNARFATCDIEQNATMRRDWRELLVTTPALNESISGVILFDETIRQEGEGGRSFVEMLATAQIIPGIKVDAGCTDLLDHAGETITKGLDGLAERLAEYAAMGAHFAKWRAVFTVDAGMPSRSAIEANAEALARYAVMCQRAGLVPVVEPEVLMRGDHVIGRCADATEAVLSAVFQHCQAQHVSFDSMILKPNMVMAGADAPIQSGIVDLAAATIRVLVRVAPISVAGIAFLSGGQSACVATARLNAMNVQFGATVPWPLSFSYGRALQQPALSIWRGKPANAGAVQLAIAHRAALNRAARRGCYDVSMERGAVPEAGGLALVN